MSSRSERPASSLRADLVLIGVTVIWGTTFVVVRTVLDTAPPFRFVFWRFLAAGVALAVIAMFRPRTRGILRDGTILGLILASGVVLQISGQAETTASKAAFLTGLAVVLTPFVAVLRTRNLPTVENGVGITLASIGFFLLTFPSDGGPMNRGDPLVLVCGVVFAFYGVELAERGGRHDAVWLTLVQIAFVATAGGLFSLLVKLPALANLHAASLEARPILWTKPFVVSVVYLGSIGTVVAFLGWTWAQGRMSAIHGAIILALEPVFAAIFAAWFLHERLGARGLWGGVLVLAGIVISELRLVPRRGASEDSDAAKASKKAPG
ncbi:MAG TPA: DMT family transporter [Thermoanaerobaculia bacterium]